MEREAGSGAHNGLRDCAVGQSGCALFGNGLKNGSKFRIFQQMPLLPRLAIGIEEIGTGGGIVAQCSFVG